MGEASFVTLEGGGTIVKRLRKIVPSAYFDFLLTISRRSHKMPDFAHECVRLS